jgi:protein-S-isoprenylcysteine O-methyltransferase Ste14
MPFLGKMGLVLAIVGLGVEGLAVVAMAFWPVRKRLPNPFVVQSAGFGLFVVGLLLYAIGSAQMSD